MPIYRGSTQVNKVYRGAVALAQVYAAAEPLLSALDVVVFDAFDRGPTRLISSPKPNIGPDWVAFFSGNGDISLDGASRIYCNATANTVQALANGSLATLKGRITGGIQVGSVSGGTLTAAVMFWAENNATNWRAGIERIGSNSTMRIWRNGISVGSQAIANVDVNTPFEVLFDQAASPNVTFTIPGFGSCTASGAATLANSKTGVYFVQTVQQTAMFLDDFTVEIPA